MRVKEFDMGAKGTLGSLLLGGKIMPMNRLVAGFQHYSKLSPDDRKGAVRPSCACVGESRYFAGTAVVVLFGAPLERQVAIEDLAPSNS